MKVFLKGYTGCKGIAEGEVLVCRKPFMFLSYVDLNDAKILHRINSLGGLLKGI
jgi:predicted aconitase with swiveling domain